jgi:SAM-dependent methyltransferase
MFEKIDFTPIDFTPREFPPMSSCSVPQTVWPPEKTETLALCPGCDSGHTSILHAAAEDRVFGCPGTWTIRECHHCGIGFLNPRLTTDAIGEAYANYYTHATPAHRTLRLLVRDYVVNAYARRRFGRRWRPYLAWSDWVMRKRLPTVTAGMEAYYRYLPRPTRNAALLDVGCGNGDFLRQVEPLGWYAVGLESDPKAYAVAVERKLNVVKGSVPNTGLPDNYFDAVTLNHVIEHVHDPRRVLLELFRISKPGGRVVLTTPNWRSYGAQLFGHYWRGFEPPRHLVLFTPGSLSAAVSKAGFVEPEIRVQPEVADFFFLQSHAIAFSAPAGSLPLTPELEIELQRAQAAARLDANLAEQFTVIAIKPAVASRPAHSGWAGSGPIHTRAIHTNAIHADAIHVEKAVHFQP